MEPPGLPDNNRQKKRAAAPGSPDSSLRFMDIGVRMCVIIGGGTLLGKWIDHLASMKTPLFMISGAMLATAAAMYMIIKEVSAKDET